MNSAGSQTAQIILAFSKSSIFPVIEFAAISGIIMVTYIALHNMFNHLKPATKMLVSLFLGTMAYSLGKLALLTLIINPFATPVIQL